MARSTARRWRRGCRSWAGTRGTCHTWPAMASRVEWYRWVTMPRLPPRCGRWPRTSRCAAGSLRRRNGAPPRFPPGRKRLGGCSRSCGWWRERQHREPFLAVGQPHLATYASGARAHDCVVVLGLDSPGAHQPSRDDEAEYETSDVGEERDPFAIGVRCEQTEVRLDQLVEEPEAEEDVGGNPHEPNHDEREYARSRIEHEVRAEHRGDRAGGAQVRSVCVGSRAGEQCHRGLRHHRDEAAGEVEQKVANRPESVLDILPEDRQEEHVPEDVVPTAVHEHRRDPADPRRQRPTARVVDRAWIEGAVGDGRVQVRQLIEDPHREVRDNKRDVDEREIACWETIRQRKHAQQSAAAPENRISVKWLKSRWSARCRRPSGRSRSEPSAGAMV